MKLSNITRGAIVITALFLSLLTADSASAAITWLSSITGQDAGVPMVAPSRIAVDGAGNIYVTESRNNKNRVLVFDRFGKYSRTLHAGISDPIGVAVDGRGRIYVGNSGTHSVDVFEPDFSPASVKIGSGNGEVRKPTAIAVTSAGMIYVVDLSANVVKVYNADGKPAFTFGGEGSVDGKFLNPNGIAIDETRNELYVTDRAQFYNPTDRSNPGGPRVQVFTLDGVFVRSFWTYGANYENVGTLIGIAADGEGDLYIVDSKLQMVHVYKTTGQMSETISLSKLRTGLGLAIGKDKRMFIANSNSGTVEVYGLPGYTTLSVSSSRLDFTAAEGMDTLTQTVTISNSGLGALDWSAAAATADGRTWLSVTPSGSSPAGGTSTATVSVKTAGLVAGIYAGTVTVTALSGAQETIAVNLTITQPPAVLSVKPGSLAFNAQLGGPSPQPQSIIIMNAGGGSMTWTASKGAKWITLNVSASAVEVVPNTALIGAAGTYADQITILANAQRSPTVIPVTLQVLSAGTVKVTSNISNAAFDITGSSGTYSGTGTVWTSDQVKPGEYTLTFKKVPGYVKPASHKFSVATGQESLLTGYYRKRPAASHVIAGSADKDGKNQMIAVVPLIADQKMPVTFTAFTNAESVRVGAGDLDATGVSTIVATDNKRSIKVFSAQGEVLASHDLPEGFNHADVAVGDVDNDGKADILIGAESQTQPRRMIKAFTYAANSLQEKATLLSEDREGGFTMAAGDLNDDGLIEVLVADQTSIRAFSVEQASGLALAQLWVKNGDYGIRPQIAAGDINGDGILEAAVSYGRAKEGKGRGRDKEQTSLVSILKGTGEDFGLTIEPFKDLGYAKPATIVMGDVDGDGADEVVAGAGPAAANDPLVRIFENDGTYAGITMKPMNGRFGVNVGLGSFTAD